MSTIFYPNPGTRSIDYVPEVFLLYNLEFTYAAAIHLAMAKALFPEAVNGQTSVQEAHSILDQMISNGNRIAEVGKEELLCLESLFLELATRAEAKGLQPLTLSTSIDREARPETSFMASQEEGPRGDLVDNPGFIGLSIPSYARSPQPPDMHIPSVELLDDIGISSTDFFSIVSQFESSDMSYSALGL